MRKQTKVLAAAALFTLGASFSAFAAKTGTWQLEEDGWYCYDADGDAYEDEFCLSAGKEFYMGDDGLMVTNSWVEYDDAYYYVGSDGSKTINDWRFVAPEEDEEEEAEWFYFNGKGKRVSGKQVIDGKTYYFDADGKMLTGWVDYTDKVASEGDEDDTNLVYCGEDGARLSKAWVNTWPAGTDEDDADEDDMEWYWIKSSGAAQTGRNIDINGEMYFFAKDGHMLSGWVATTDGKNYEEIGYEGSKVVLSSYVGGDCAVYFCGDSDQGWAKKNKWVKTWNPANYDEADSDEDQYWFWIAKSGKVYVPTETTSANALTFKDGSDNDFDDDAIENGAAFKEVNNKTYAFNGNGEMLDGLNEIDGLYYYFGGSNDGEMKTGSVTIEDKEGETYKFFFGKKTDKEDGYIKGAGVTGAASGELYINGLIQEASKEDYEQITVKIDGVDYNFVVDADGDIRTAKKEYENDDDVVYLDTRESNNVKFTGLDGVKKGSYLGDATK